MEWTGKCPIRWYDIRAILRSKIVTERRRSIRALDEGGVGSLVVKYSDLRNTKKMPRMSAVISWLGALGRAVVNLPVRPRGLIDLLPMSLKAFVAKSVVIVILI